MACHHDAREALSFRSGIGAHRGYWGQRMVSGDGRKGVTACLRFSPVDFWGRRLSPTELSIYRSKQRYSQFSVGLGWRLRTAIQPLDRLRP